MGDMKLDSDNSVYRSLCRSKSYGATAAWESCERFVDMCAAGGGSRYELCFDRSSKAPSPSGNMTECSSFPNMVDCLKQAQDFTLKGYLLDSRMHQARKKLLGDKGLEELIPEDCRHLKSYLSSGFDQRVLDLMSAAGLNTFIALSRKAGDRTEALMKNLASVSYLIESAEGIPRVAEGILRYIDAVRAECGKIEFMEETYRRADSFALISQATPEIKSPDDIDRVGPDLAALASPYCHVMNYFLDDPLDDFTRLEPAIRKYGAAPLTAILKSSGKEAIEWIVRDDAQKVIDKYGIDAFVKMAKEEGKDASNLFYVFVGSDTRDLVEKFGIPILFQLFNEANKMHPGNAANYIRNFCSVVSKPILLATSTLEMKSTGADILELTKELDHNGFFWFASAVKLFKDDMSNADDLMCVARALMKYREANGVDMQLVLDVLKTSGASKKADLAKELVSHAEAAAKKSDSEKVYVLLARLQANSISSSFAAVKTMDEYEKKCGRTVGEFAELRFKCAFKWLDASRETATSYGLAGVTADYVAKIKAQFETVRDKYPASKHAPMAAMMCDVLQRNEYPPELITVSKGAGVTVKVVSGLDRISLVYVGDGQAPEVIPGKARVSRGKLIVPVFDGRVKVVFKKPVETVPENVDALFEALRILPDAMLVKLNGFVFTGENHEGRAGAYLEVGDAQGMVEVDKSFDKLGTIVHEVGHHWDLSVSENDKGGQGGDSDFSKLYYDISWKGVSKKKYMHGSKYGKVELKRDDFDHADFAEEYGLCNPNEDIATMIEAYVMEGPDLRKRIRRQMDQGNFELAAKYLFVRHIVSFDGKEYGESGDSLEFEEVLEKYDATADRSKTRDPDTRETIIKMKEYHSVPKFDTGPRFEIFNSVLAPYRPE